MAFQGKQIISSNWVAINHMPTDLSKKIHLQNQDDTGIYVVDSTTLPTDLTQTGIILYPQQLRTYEKTAGSFLYARSTGNDVVIAIDVDP